MNNLIDFPSVNCITLESSKERQEFMLEQTKKYNLKCNFHYAYNALEKPMAELIEVSSPFLWEMNEGEICTVASHLKAIRQWYYDSEEEYAFFCEDDVNLSVSENWSFTWKQFIEKLPSDWGIFQLVLARDFENENLEESIKVHQCLWDDWSACGYIVSRKYAKGLIDYHCKDENTYDLMLPWFPDCIPHVETLLFGLYCKGMSYALPMFVENADFPSYFYPKFIETEIKIYQRKASEIVKNWWQVEGKYRTLDWFFRP